MRPPSVFSNWFRDFAAIDQLQYSNGLLTAVWASHDKCPRHANSGPSSINGCSGAVRGAAITTTEACESFSVLPIRATVLQDPQTAKKHDHCNPDSSRDHTSHHIAERLRSLAAAAGETVNPEECG